MGKEVGRRWIDRSFEKESSVVRGKELSFWLLGDIVWAYARTQLGWHLRELYSCSDSHSQALNHAKKTLRYSDIGLSYIRGSINQYKFKRDSKET